MRGRLFHLALGSTFGEVRHERKPAMLVIVNLMKLYNQWKLRMISVNGREKRKAKRNWIFSLFFDVKSNIWDFSFVFDYIASKHCLFGTKSSSNAHSSMPENPSEKARVFSLSKASNDRIHQDFPPRLSFSRSLVLSFSCLPPCDALREEKVARERRKQRCRMFRAGENHSARVELVIDVVSVQLEIFCG